MTPQTFRRCLDAAFGASLYRASAELGISLKKIRGMVKGKERIYPETAARVIALVRQRAKHNRALLSELKEGQTDG